MAFSRARPVVRPAASRAARRLVFAAPRGPVPVPPVGPAVVPSVASVRAVLAQVGLALVAGGDDGGLDVGVCQRLAADLRVVWRAVGALGAGA